VPSAGEFYALKGMDRILQKRFLLLGVWAQVAERLMAADCKSAAPWSYGGSNPPLCTTSFGFAVREGAGHMNLSRAEHKRMVEGLHSSAEEMDRKYWIALVLFAVLAGLVWFTMGEGKVLIYGKPVELRLLPLVVIGGLALRTVLARSAEKIRRSGEKDSEGLEG
jgi:hypothetical protein